MNFKESEVVQQEVKVINSMQDQLAEMTLAFPAMTADEREEYVNLIEALLEKQSILWMRVELSKNDDETAALMASDVRKVMDAIGIPKDVCVKDVFNNIDEKSVFVSLQALGSSKHSGPNIDFSMILMRNLYVSACKPLEFYVSIQRPKLILQRD